MLGIHSLQRSWIFYRNRNRFKNKNLAPSTYFTLNSRLVVIWIGLSDVVNSWSKYSISVLIFTTKNENFPNNSKAVCIFGHRVHVISIEWQMAMQWKNALGFYVVCKQHCFTIGVHFLCGQWFYGVHGMRWCNLWKYHCVCLLSGHRFQTKFTLWKHW